MPPSLFPGREEYRMDYPMFAVLLTGNAILVAGILIRRGPGETLQSAMRECAIWGTFFFVSFGSEMLMIANR